MSKRFRYLMLATTMSLGMWAAIIFGSIAIFNSLPVFVSYDDLAVLQDQLALQTGHAGTRDVSHE